MECWSIGSRVIVHDPDYEIIRLYFRHHSITPVLRYSKSSVAAPAALCQSLYVMLRSTSISSFIVAMNLAAALYAC